MGKSGRYGKYGEIKRLDRLRQSGMRGASFSRKGSGVEASGFLGRKGRPERARSQVMLREGSERDAEFIRQLGQKVFGIYGPYDELLPLWLTSHMTVTIVAAIGKKSVGFVMLGRPSGAQRFDLTGEVLAIAVEPEQHRRGNGNLLMEEVIRRAERLYTERLILHTAPQNRAAIGLFLKHGFSEGEVKKRFYPEGQDALLMERSIP